MSLCVGQNNFVPFRTEALQMKSWHNSEANIYIHPRATYPLPKFLSSSSSLIKHSAQISIDRGNIGGGLGR